MFSDEQARIVIAAIDTHARYNHIDAATARDMAEITSKVQSGITGVLAVDCEGDTEFFERLGPNEGETVQERYVRLGSEKPGGYGTSGGSAGDHMLALREAIERGEGDKVYPT